MSDTDLVWPGELWLLNLEVEKSRQGDGIEKPGSEADSSNKKKKKECQEFTIQLLTHTHIYKCMYI